jgi:hypothetical protein
MTALRLRAWWAMAPVIAAGVVIVGMGHVRLAGYVVAAGMGFGALLRLVLPRSLSGGLAVRSRVIDVLTMTILGVALAVATFALDLRPRG